MFHPQVRCFDCQLCYFVSLSSSLSPTLPSPGTAMSMIQASISSNFQPRWVGLCLSRLQLHPSAHVQLFPPSHGVLSQLEPKGRKMKAVWRRRRSCTHERSQEHALKQWSTNFSKPWTNWGSRVHAWGRDTPAITGGWGALVVGGARLHTCTGRRGRARGLTRCACTDARMGRACLLYTSPSPRD